jgi:esterase
MPGEFLPHYELVSAAGAAPSAWMLALHGLLGSGANLRSLVRRLAEACPAWGFVLVDLRAHGASRGAPPPHTVIAAAEDLVRLQGALELPVRGVIGHSLGGKVALALLTVSPAPFDQAWVLDAQPGPRHAPESALGTAAVLRMLDELPALLPSRERFVELVTERGHSRGVAAWLATNLRRDDDGYRLRVDLTAIRALFESYAATDLWPVVESRKNARRLGFVIGGRSEVLGAEDRARLAALAERDPNLHVAVLPAASHWVHTDDPDGVLKIVAEALCAVTPSE